MSLLGCWVNRYYAIYRAYNGARTRLLLYSAYYSNVQAMCGNVQQCAICCYTQCSARVGLYGVGGMRWEQVVVYKVLWGGPVTQT